MKWGWALLLVAAGCSSRHQETTTARQRPHAEVSSWNAVWLDPSDPTPAYLSNGLVGFRIGRDGQVVENGLFDITNYQQSGEEKIIPINCRFSGLWNGLLQPDKSGDYRQELDFRTGVLKTAWTQVMSQVDVKVATEACVSKSWNAAAFRWTLTPQKEISIDLPTAESGDPGDPLRIQVFYHRSKSRFFGPGRPATADLVLVFKSFEDVKTVLNYDDIARQSATNQNSECDIEIDGPVEDQQAIRSWMFYLRSSLNPSSEFSISPFALSNDLYGGHVFWDADTWVFPALCFISPDRAKAIADFRLGRVKSAGQNALDWFMRSPPKNGWQRVWPTDEDYKPYASIKEQRLMFPWESGPTGREVAPPEFRQEQHITGCVMRMLDTAQFLGLSKRTDVEKAGRGAAKFWLDRIEYGAWNRPGSYGNFGPFDIKGIRSPDEFHVGDNDLFTNLLANWTLDRFNPENKLPYNGLEMLGMETRCKGGGSGPSIHLPGDRISFLTYDDDPVRAYKQAAAVLAIYPLQFPPAEKQARAMMDRFADKVIKNGPAMSDAIHAIIWARLGENEKAYATWQNAWKPFMSAPLCLFSEKRNQPNRTYFTTGAAGCLQSVLYGFLGFRIDSREEPGAAWSKKLNGESWLSIRPHLPSAWKKVTFKNFSLLGHHYTLTATHDSVKVTQGD